MAIALPDKTLVTVISGRFGEYIFTPRQGQDPTIRGVYADRKETEKQKEWRTKYEKVDDTWKSLTPAERDCWRLRPWKKAWSNYAYFMSRNLRAVATGADIDLVPYT